jgi:hypothetical protein
MSSAELRGGPKGKAKGTVAQEGSGTAEGYRLNRENKGDFEALMADRLPQEVWEVFDPEEQLGSDEPEYGDFWLEPGEDEEP